MSANEKVQVPTNNLEAALELGDVKYGKPAKDDDGGYIAKENHGMTIAIMVGFVVTFLADFCSKLAYAAYQESALPPASPPLKQDFELLFTLNMVHGCMFLPCVLCLAAPEWTGLSKMFVSLFWDHETDPKSAARIMEKQMAGIFLGLCIAQLVQPSNPGVGLACLILTCCTFFNFFAAVALNTYSKLHNRVLMWTGFLVAPIVFIGAFTVALNRVQFFNSVAYPWKDSAAGDDQSLLFYVNMVHGLMYLPIALLNLSDRGERWFMGWFLTEHPTEERGPTAWVMKNCSLGFIAMSITNIVAPSNTGVGVVMFFLNVCMFFVFLQAVFGGIKTVKNKMLWGGFLVNTLVFAVLFAVALKKLNFSYDLGEAQLPCLTDTPCPWNVAS